MKCFVDSNVFISLIQDEFGKGLEFMSYRTQEYFNRVMRCFHTIFISETIIDEVCKITNITLSGFMDYINMFRDKIIILQNKKDELMEAEAVNKKYKIGNDDALYYVTARNNNCDCIVTWNKKHFLFAEDELRIVNPSEL
ncbi:MAG: type II toxin-antitoxin system VapC family toxin [Candidatus Nanoarchaeia archaeon]|nr:type II toxin-antitoxin system VapC family toxin [Candidatus Nanoarchaeia archaeon]